MLNQPRTLKKLLIIAGLTLFFSGIFLVLFSRIMQRQYSRDENQFVASGALLADSGLLPYQDYPYFHMPNLVFVYALVYKATDYNLLGARLVSLFSALAGLGLVFYLAYDFFQEHKPLTRLLFAGGGVLFLLANPLFVYTSGLAWNHDLPVLLVLMAFCTHYFGARQPRPGRWSFASGFLVGLAAGFRLSFILAVLPFLLTLFLYPNAASRAARLNLVKTFSLGVFLSLLPAILLFILAPQGFVFGNLGYARLNTLYQLDTGFEGPMTLSGKLNYLIQNVFSPPGNLLVLLSTIFFAFSLGMAALWRERKLNFEITFILSLILSLFMGAFLPTPAWYQYFYAPVPFAILGILYGIARLSGEGLRKGWTLVLFIQIVVISNLLGLESYAPLKLLRYPDLWYPLQAHELGKEIQFEAGAGKVLTLSPQYPLEGDAAIYPSFATGPFAWRTGYLLDKEQRAELNVISADELGSLLEKDPPTAILVGRHEPDEELFIQYAEQHGYERRKLAEDLFIWTP
jgi:4-amino-4-deoxy-L-arabinose transferase-like glycosyltransferase